MPVFLPKANSVDMRQYGKCRKCKLCYTSIRFIL